MSLPISCWRSLVRIRTRAPFWRANRDWTTEWCPSSQGTWINQFPQFTRYSQESLRIDLVLYPPAIGRVAPNYYQVQAP